MGLLDNRQQLLTVIWLLIQIFLICYCISAWVAAGNIRDFDCSTTPEGVLIPDTASIDHNEAFVLVWQSLLAIGLSVGGTLVMKRHRTPLALGFFIGVCIVMSNWMLCIAVSEGGRVYNKKATHCLENYSTGADRAVIAFAVFLFLLYAAFGVLITKFRDEVLGAGSMASQMQDEQQYDDDSEERFNTATAATEV